MTQVLPQGINTIFSNYLKFIYNTTTKSKFAVSPLRFDSITGNNMATPSGSSSSKSRVKGPGGPHGYGDPEDKTLRKVEIEVMIPKKMREKTRDQKCVEEVKAFTECCKENSVAMVWMCRKQNSKLKDCLNYWYNNDEFKKECEKEYLEERSEFRRTGVTKKKRQLEASM